MNYDVLDTVNTEILFLLRDMYPNRKDLPHKKELIKIKSLLKKLQSKDVFYSGFNDSPLFSDADGNINKVSINDGEVVYSRSYHEIKYVFHEATLFLSEVLKSLISYYLDNQLIDLMESKNGSVDSVELSVVIWYGNLLDDIVNDRLVHDFIGKNYIALYQFKKEFENKKLSDVKAVASLEFKTKLSEISEVERVKFGDILNGTMKSMSGYYEEIRDSVKLELEKLREGNQNLNEIESGSEFYKNKIKQVYEDCETRKKSIDAVFFASKKQGMAKSFQDMAEELQHTIRLWLGVFIISLGVVAWNGYLLNDIVNKQMLLANMERVGNSEVESFDNENDVQKKQPNEIDIGIDSKEEILSIKAIVIRFLMITPFLWLAWFSGRQYSHSNKLRQDYIYKSAIAMAYQGYKEESTEMGGDMHNKLLENIVEHFSDNPVRLYEKCDSSSPLEELIKKLSPEGVAEIIKALKSK